MEDVQHYGQSLLDALSDAFVGGEANSQSTKVFMLFEGDCRYLFRAFFGSCDKSKIICYALLNVKR